MPAAKAKAMPCGSSAVVCCVHGQGSSNPKPNAAKTTHSQSLGFLEVQTATANGPVNSMAMATPNGMVLMAL